MENQKNQFIKIEKTIEEIEAMLEHIKVDCSDEVEEIRSKLQSLKPKEKSHSRRSSWEIVQKAREPKRPTFRYYIEHVFHDFKELKGDRLYGDDPAIICGLAYLRDMPVTLIGHEKGRNTKERVHHNFGMPHPEGYRKALRLMKQAEKFGRPIICFIDTPGAYCGIEAEQRGQAEAIAQNLKVMSELETPIISIVIGEGGSGGALALGIADKMYMLENTYYSVISPEACASILWKDVSLAQKASELLRSSAEDLYDFLLIDGIIEEEEGGENLSTAKKVEEVIFQALLELKETSIEEILLQRYQKFRQIGCAL